MERLCSPRVYVICSFHGKFSCWSECGVAQLSAVGKEEESKSCSIYRIYFTGNFCRKCLSQTINILNITNLQITVLNNSFILTLLQSQSAPNRSYTQHWEGVSCVCSTQEPATAPRQGPTGRATRRMEEGRVPAAAREGGLLLAQGHAPRQPSRHPHLPRVTRGCGCRYSSHMRLPEGRRGAACWEPSDAAPPS